MLSLIVSGLAQAQSASGAAESAASSGAAGATSGPAPAAGPGSSMWINILFIGAIIAIFYFFMIRPQKRREKERMNLLSAIKKGDRVRTIGGLYGEIVNTKEKHVILSVDRETGTTLKVDRQAIAEVVNPEVEE